MIEEVRIQRDKGFGFVRYSTHAEAALAIQMGNTQSFLCGKQIKVSFSAFTLSFNFFFRNNCCTFIHSETDAFSRKTVLWHMVATFAVLRTRMEQD